MTYQTSKMECFANIVNGLRFRNSIHFFCSKVVGFGPENYSVTEIALNHARFPVSFQNS